MEMSMTHSISTLRLIQQNIKSVYHTWTLMTSIHIHSRKQIDNGRSIHASVPVELQETA